MVRKDSKTLPSKVLGGEFSKYNLDKTRATLFRKEMVREILENIGVEEYINSY